MLLQGLNPDKNKGDQFTVCLSCSVALKDVIQRALETLLCRFSVGFVMSCYVALWAGGPSWVETFGKSACPTTSSHLDSRPVVNGSVRPRYASLADI